MRIVFAESYANDSRTLKARFPTMEIGVLETPLSPENVELAEDPEILSVFIESDVGRETLDKMPSLKFIAVRSTGYDNIDLQACADRGILVANVPLYGANTVAEHTFALMLALSRKLMQSYERTERLNFERAGLQGFDLYNRVLGVVGTGNIGEHVVRIGHALGMRVVAYDLEPKQELVDAYGVTYTKTLAELLEQSHVVTLHVPLTPSTYHLINNETIAQMHPGSLLINTSRGSLVDTQALLEALDSQILIGAGLDVLEGESETYEDVALLSRSFPQNKDVVASILRNHILVARDDVLITPHNAFNSVEAVQRLFDTTLDNVQAFLDQSPRNLVKAGE